MIEWEEKRFEYRVRCSSDENNEDEEMEEGIGVSWASECRWLLLEEPLRFFDGSTIWETYSKFELVEMKENEKNEFWALWEVIWIRNEWVMAERKIGNEGFVREMEVLVREFWNLNL